MFDSRQYHRLNCVCEFVRGNIESSFFYVDESRPVDERSDDDIGDVFVVGNMYNNGITTPGFLYIPKMNTTKTSECFFTEDNNVTFRLTKSQIDAVVADFEYEHLDQPLVEKFQVPQQTKMLPSAVFNVATPDHVTPYAFIMKQIAEHCEGKTLNDDLNQIADIWKSYKREKMAEYMAVAKHIPPERICRCPFMSVETIRENPKYKFDWSELTINESIPIRDILNNPDLPWNYTMLDERSDVSLEILRSKGVFTNNDFDEVKVYSEMEIAMSPQDPPPLVAEAGISDELINEAIGDLMEENPLYFDKIPVDLLSRVCFEVIYHLRNLPDHMFDIDSFELPSLDGEEFEVSFDVEPTKDDPLGLRLAIAELQNPNSKNKYAARKFYASRIGTSRLCDENFIAKNRTEYLEYMKNVKSSFYQHKCVFFELEDVLNNKKAFFCRNNDHDGTGIMAESGKLTVEFFLQSTLRWYLDDLVKALPFKFVFENLLFYPNRIKFANIVENQFEIHLFESGDLKEALMKQDELAMIAFCSRSDFDFEYYIQYRSVKWNFIGAKWNYTQTSPGNPYAYNNCVLLGDHEIITILNNMPSSFSEIMSNGGIENLKEGDDYKCHSILNTMTWDDLKTKDGFEILFQAVEFRRVEIKDMLKITDRNVFGLVNKLYDCSTNFITPAIIGQNPKIKWDLNINLNVVDLLKYFMNYVSSNSEKGTPSFPSLFVYLQDINVIKSRDSKYFMVVMHYVMKELIKNSEDKVRAYEDIVEFLPELAILLEKFEMFPHEIKKNLELLVYHFPVEVVGASSYTDIKKIVNNMNIK